MSDWIRLTPQFPSTDDLVVVGRKKTEDETGHYLRYARTENGVLSIRDVPPFFLLDTEALAFAAQLDEVRALKQFALNVRREYNAVTATQHWPIAEEWAAWVDNEARKALVPFEGLSDG